MKLEFPQYPRIFSALLSNKRVSNLGRLILWLCLALLIAINVRVRSSSVDPFMAKRMGVLREPYAREPHVEYAATLFQKGLLYLARRELLLAEEGLSRVESLTDQPVLGASAPPFELLTQWEREPLQIAKAYEYWESVVREKPTYVPGYVRAGAAAYQLGKLSEARQYLTQAVQLGSDDALALSLLKELSL